MGGLFLTGSKRDNCVDQRKSRTASDSTPGSLKSLEPLPPYPFRHLLSNFSERQLDTDFCPPSDCSVTTNGYDDTPGDSLSPLSATRSSAAGCPLRDSRSSAAGFPLHDTKSSAVGSP